jgi:hypothetical protein
MRSEAFNHDGGKQKQACREAGLFYMHIGERLIL